MTDIRLAAPIAHSAVGPPMRQPCYAANLEKRGGSRFDLAQPRSVGAWPEPLSARRDAARPRRPWTVLPPRALGRVDLGQSAGGRATARSTLICVKGTRAPGGYRSATLETR